MTIWLGAMSDFLGWVWNSAALRVEPLQGRLRGAQPDSLLDASRVSRRICGHAATGADGWVRKPVAFARAAKAATISEDEGGIARLLWVRGLGIGCASVRGCYLRRCGLIGRSG